jgi:hypothetical protein
MDDNNSLEGLELPVDDIYLQWLEANSFSQPIKLLFGKLPYIWQDYIDTSNTKRLVEFTSQLLLMKQTHGNSISFLPEPLKLYASDCFVLLGQYTDALEFFPLPSIGSRSSTATDSLLSLKLVTGNKIAGRDVLTLCGPKVTEFGKKHLESVLAQADVQLESLWNTTRVDLIAEWAKGSHQCPYQVGIGSRYVYYLTKNGMCQ